MRASDVMLLRRALGALGMRPAAAYTAGQEQERRAVREALKARLDEVGLEAVHSEVTCAACPHPAKFHDSDWAAREDSDEECDSCDVEGCMCEHFEVAPAAGVSA